MYIKRILVITIVWIGNPSIFLLNKHIFMNGLTCKQERWSSFCLYSRTPDPLPNQPNTDLLFFEYVDEYLTYRGAKLGGWRPEWWCWSPGRLAPRSAPQVPRAPPPPGCRPTGSMRSQAPAWGGRRWHSSPRSRESLPGWPLSAFLRFLGCCWVFFLGRLAGCQQPALKRHIRPPMRCVTDPEILPKYHMRMWL